MQLIMNKLCANKFSLKCTVIHSRQLLCLTHSPSADLSQAVRIVATETHNRRGVNLIQDQLSKSSH